MRFCYLVILLASVLCHAMESQFVVDSKELLSLPNELLGEICCHLVDIRELDGHTTINLDGGLRSLYAYSVTNKRIKKVVESFLDSIPLRTYLRSLLIERSFTLHHALISACMNNLTYTAKLILRVESTIGSHIPLFICQYGRRAMHYAALFNSTKVLNLLIEKGFHIDIKDKDGDTPLHLTVDRLSIDAARLLLKHGARVFTENNAGMTPFDRILQRRLKPSEDANQFIELKALLKRGEKEANLLQHGIHRVRRFVRVHTN